MVKIMPANLQEHSKRLLEQHQQSIAGSLLTKKVRLEQKTTPLERNNSNHSDILSSMERNMLHCLKGKVS